MRQDTTPLEDAAQTLDVLEIVDGTCFSLRTLADLFTRSFEGYMVPIRMTAENLSRILRTESADLAASRVILHKGKPAGFILIASRGLTRRVCAMGVTPPLRNQGIGYHLMKEVIQDARKHGFRKMLLEVIETNQHALQLYEHLGFQETRTLVGWEREPGNPPPPSEDVLKPMDPAALAKVIEYEGPNNLPWQLAAESIVGHTPPSIAYRLGDKAYVLVAALTDQMAVLGGIIVPSTLRRHGWGKRLIDALVRLYPDRNLRFPARLPENLAPDFFLEQGFKRAALTQKELVLDLEQESETMESTPGR